MNKIAIILLLIVSANAQSTKINAIMEMQASALASKSYGEGDQ